MKLLALVSAAGALLLLPQTVLAAPIIEARTTTTSDASAIDSTNTNSSDADSESSGKSPTSVEVAADYGSPRCKTKELDDLCLAKNVGARCDVTGFHNDLGSMCQDVCSCGW